MASEDTDVAVDFFLRAVPDIKIGKELPVITHPDRKEELKSLRMTDSTSEHIMDTLKYIYGPEFKLKDARDYKNVKSNLNRNYWVDRGELVVKGCVDYSNSENMYGEDSDIFKYFAMLRLESYGFHQNHCIEAFGHCDGDIEESLSLLYSRYFPICDASSEVECDNMTEEHLLEMRSDEKCSIESIYEKSFEEKVMNNVWILKLKLDYLIQLLHYNKFIKRPKAKENNDKNKVPKCRNFLAGNCKFGKKCRFSHEVAVPVVNPNCHLTDFTFQLEIRFPPKSRYPYEPPLIFLKTDGVVPPLVNLHIAKRLYEEAKILAETGMPCVYSITELLKNEDEIKTHLDTEICFIPPTEKLIPTERILMNNLLGPTHYKKGKTSKDMRVLLTNDEIATENKKIIRRFKEKLNDARYSKMQVSREKLPAWSFKDKIVSAISQFQVVIVSGETGCGKSTQIPQYILDNWIKNYDEGKVSHVEIICTQPRRISAIGVAERVADERVERVGNTVGYKIRLESKTSAGTRLTFCTTGILLRNLEMNPTLKNVTHVIVDEVHERSEESDFLLMILKELLVNRPDLKLILMSATLNAQLFETYFRGAPVINIPGRTFPVESIFLEEILEETGFVVDCNTQYARKFPKGERDAYKSLEEITCGINPRLDFPDERLTLPQLVARYKDYSPQTCKSLYLMDTEKINNELIETVLTWIVSGDHNHPNDGTILIFLPGFAEINSLYEELSSHREFGKRSNKYLLLPLHSTLTSQEQAAIFLKPKNNMRKIILSTNIAETSVTIDDCVFVIDSGKMKETRFDPNRNMESLDTVWITQANSNQRKGRAGRVMPGVCVFLYTKNRYNHCMLKEPVPEIHRIPLEKLVLHIMILPHFGDRDVKQVLARFIEPPTLEQIDTAIQRLQDVGALDKERNLTVLGRHLATLPVDVRIGKLILYGAIFGCVDAALTIGASLNYKSPFINPFQRRKEAQESKVKFSAGYSDQLTILMAYRRWLTVLKTGKFAARRFAEENFLDNQTLQTLADIKHQFLELLVDIGFVSANITNLRNCGHDKVLQVTGSEFNKNGENIPVLVAILCAALYPNVVKVLTPSKSFISSATGAVAKTHDAKELKFVTVRETVFMHPSSVNYEVSEYPSPYLVYQEKVKTAKLYFKNCTMVPAMSLVLFSGFDLEISVQNDVTYISLNNGWILFKVDEHKVAELIKMLRQELFLLLQEKINDPLLNLMNHDKGKLIISNILELINAK